MGRYDAVARNAIRRNNEDLAHINKQLDAVSMVNKKDIFFLEGTTKATITSVGSTNASENGRVSDYIPIDRTHSYFIPGYCLGYNFANSNKVSLGTRLGYQQSNITINSDDIPATAEYIRICWTVNQTTPTTYSPNESVHIYDLDAYQQKINDDDIFFSWDAANKVLYVYMKASYANYWMCYAFQNLIGDESSDATTWYNVWRLRTVRIWTKDDEDVFTQAHPHSFVHVGSEWECAIKEDGQVDFVGGSTHGDEYVESIVFLLDGKSFTDPLLFAGKMTCKEFKIFRSGSLYRCDSKKVTKIANHAVDYTFKDNDITVNQNVDWVVSTTTDISYLTMLGIKRLDDGGNQITSRALKEGEALVYDVSVDGFTHGAYQPLTNCKKAYLWNEVTGFKVSATVEILESNCPSTNNFKVDNRVDYNKMYFDFCGNNYAVTSGSRWHNKAKYTIDYHGVVV